MYGGVVGRVVEGRVVEWLNGLDGLDGLDGWMDGGDGEMGRRGDGNNGENSTSFHPEPLSRLSHPNSLQKLERVEAGHWHCYSYLHLSWVLARSTADDRKMKSSYSLQARSKSISNIQFTSCMRLTHGLGAKE